MARVLEETVFTIEVEEVCTLGSAITGVTVKTVDCVVNGTTGAADINETGVVEEISVATKTEAVILGYAITFVTAVGAELVPADSVGVIVTLNAGCANRLETGSTVLRRLESDDAC